jgi:hypothetical protein
MRKRELFLLLFASTIFSQVDHLSLALQAQAVNSLYMTHQAISTTVNQFAARPESRAELLQNLQNYRLMSENLATQLRDLKGTKDSRLDTVFLEKLIQTQEKLAQMAAAYRRFVLELDPKFANEYNRLHKETWAKIKEKLYLED